MKKLVVVVMMLLVAGVACGQPISGTADVTKIKPVTVQTQSNVQAYTIPVTQSLPKADGSGDVSVIVQTLTVTKAQLTQAITNINQQITNAQKQVADLQAQEAAITTLEKEPAK